MTRDERTGQLNDTGLESVRRSAIRRQSCDPDLTPIPCVVTMAAAYHGGIPIPDGDKYAMDPGVLDALKRAMDYWFAHDYSNDACLEYGGGSQCPCGTPGLWNTNWYSNVSLTFPFIPDYESLIGLRLDHSYPWFLGKSLYPRSRGAF